MTDQDFWDRIAIKAFKPNDRDGRAVALQIAFITADEALAARRRHLAKSEPKSEPLKTGTVTLLNAGRSRIDTIKVLRHFLHLGLVDAKSITDKLPWTSPPLSDDVAAQFCAQLVAVGAAATTVRQVTT